MPMPEEGFCTRCGDVKACFHYPDVNIIRAYENELHAASQRNDRLDAKKRGAPKETE